MISYAVNTTKMSKAHDKLWMVQTHWQSTAGSITLGTAHRSSLLEDVERSGMNVWVADSINNMLFEHVNIVEVDNVCDHGIDIYNALTKYNENFVGKKGKK